MFFTAFGSFNGEAITTTATAPTFLTTFFTFGHQPFPEGGIAISTFTFFIITKEKNPPATPSKGGYGTLQLALAAPKYALHGLRNFERKDQAGHRSTIQTAGKSKKAERTTNHNLALNNHAHFSCALKARLADWQQNSGSLELLVLFFQEKIAKQSFTPIKAIN